MAHEIDVLAAIATKTSKSWVDREIAALADMQHGVVSDDQLAAIGLTRSAIRHRVATGRLHPLTAMCTPSVTAGSRSRAG
jgi:hypothetical protein